MTERISTYKGQNLEIVYDRKLCIHAAECGRGSRALFNVQNDPWCDPDAVSTELAADIVARCPTGALKATHKDGSPAEETPQENIVTVCSDGPLYVSGDVELEGANGQGVRTRIALCRCGQSANKPFCDGAHTKAGFRDSGAVGDKGKKNDEQGGTLNVSLANNGPLLLGGNFAIRAASGRRAFEGKKGALCRCGASKNKPFCDGAHTEIGFKG